MKTAITVILCLVFAIQTYAQNTNDRQEVLKVLSRQNENWNKGDIKAFMEDYVKSDSLMFIGKNGVIYGWKATLERYLKTYPDLATMGKLKFDIQQTDFHSPTTCWVLGKWHLTRPEKGDAGGFFTLVLKKIDGKWLIVSDHTS
ncbi:YybH family protein [Emticicia agri]|uniref:Nuclear transport factor 2 family protein n=1 Tax=Emticicia agri TaxID=2492393 RepID=A0A4Q5LZT2_9BACT|nr:nuclear transport factor 2 family protein [Emticicia agri]RYU95398.1 nuclear transport factor 2 family protein [Emticicia agri]